MNVDDHAVLPRLHPLSAWIVLFRERKTA
jgi:hypothetical protein